MITKEKYFPAATGVAVYIGFMDPTRRGGGTLTSEAHMNYKSIFELVNALPKEQR